MPTSEWSTRPLGELARLVMGQAPAGTSYNTVGNGPPFLQGSADFGERYPVASTFCSAPRKTAPQDSILISVRAPVGDLNKADRAYCIGRGLAAILPEDVQAGFLYQALLLEKHSWYRVSQGSTFAAISSDELRGFEVETPKSKTEQDKIAEVLATADEAIAQTEALIAKQERIRTGLMQDLLTKGLDEHGQIRSEATHTFKDSPLGRIPAEWKISKLAELTEADSSITYGVVKPGPDPDDGILFVRGGDFPEGRIEVEKLRRIGPEISSAYKRTLLHGGEVLIALVGQPGSCAVVPSELRGANVARQVAVVRLDKSLDPEYVKEFISSDRGQKTLLDKSIGSVQQVVNLSDLRNLDIPVPPRREQVKMTDVAHEMRKQIDASELALAKLKRLKAGLMQDLLTGRVSVEPLLGKSAS